MITITTQHKTTERAVFACSSAVFCVLILSSAASRSEDLTTLDGKTYLNITYITNYPKQIVVRYNDERIYVAISNLPGNFRAKHQIREQVKTNSVVQSGIPQTNSVDWLFARNRDSDFEAEQEVSQLVTNDPGKFQSIYIHNCSVLVQTTGFEFRVYSFKADTNGTISLAAVTNDSERDIPITIGFKFGEEAVALQIFDKFLEWETVASKNHAEPFEKAITNLYSPREATYEFDSFRKFEFKWRKDLFADSYHAYLSASYPVSGVWPLCGGIAEKSDVVTFHELLKAVPGLKENLAQKIRKKNAQKELFK